MILNAYRAGFNMFSSFSSKINLLNVFNKTFHNITIKLYES